MGYTRMQRKWTLQSSSLRSYKLHPGRLEETSGIQKIPSRECGGASGRIRRQEWNRKAGAKYFYEAKGRRKEVLWRRARILGGKSGWLTTNRNRLLSEPTTEAIVSKSPFNKGSENILSRGGVDIRAVLKKSSGYDQPWISFTRALGPSEEIPEIGPPWELQEAWWINLCGNVQGLPADKKVI